MNAFFQCNVYVNTLYVHTVFTNMDLLLCKQATTIFAYVCGIGCGLRKALVREPKRKGEDFVPFFFFCFF